MWNTSEQGLDELVRAGTHLSREMEFRALVPILVEQAFDISSSDLACLYLHTDPDDPVSPLRRAFQRGGYPAPARLDAEQEWIAFLQEVGEAVLLLEGEGSPFNGLLLHPQMQSGIALPLHTATVRLGVLVLNSRERAFYDRRRFYFLDSFVKLAGGLLHNARLFQELKEYLARIEALERYQENIFASMTNLLVTTDATGNLRYFNEAAGERFGLSSDQIGAPLESLWANSVDPGILRAIEAAQERDEELLGVEGIYRRTDGEIDFALNVSPLRAGDARNRREGTTLLFTDQSREKALQGQMAVVVEERRAIKDMFSRYLSNEILQVLMEQPELVKPGGETKLATVLFADIRGYTTFSEGHDPETIVKVLNEYFSEVVEVILRHGGYIDKFIGDAVMAAWGIPVSRNGTEIANAVSAAVTIQRAIASKRRKFFRGEAEGLRVGIGMHTGPLVAGNVGSAQRMDYTVIGDTVNIAARLEGVAKGGEVIVTQSTRDGLDDRFVIERREPVAVKGKAQPLPIYAVLDLAS